MLDMSLSGFDVVHGEQDILTDSRQLLDLSLLLGKRFSWKTSIFERDHWRQQMSNSYGQTASGGIQYSTTRAGNITRKYRTTFWRQRSHKEEDNKFIDDMMLKNTEASNNQMHVNECHRTLFWQRMFSVCKSAFSFLMSYGGTRQWSGR